MRQAEVVERSSSAAHGTPAPVRFCRMLRTPMAGIAVALLALGVGPGAAGAQGLDDPANQWLPRSDGASWTYVWSNSTYSPAPRYEQYTLQARVGTTFRLRWQEPAAPPQAIPSTGTMDFQHTDGGLVNLNYQSTPPPRAVPDPLRGRERVRQQHGWGALPGDLGHSRPRPGRAAAARDPLGRPGRGGQRRGERQPLRGPRARDGPSLPQRRRGREGRVAGHPGRRHRRPLRQRDPHRVVGARSRPGAHRVPARERRAESSRAAVDEPLADAAPVRRQPAPAQSRRSRASSAGATTST